MSAPSRVTRIELDTAAGICGITIERAGYLRATTPPVTDLPSDIRSALTEWLGVSEPKTAGALADGTR